MNSKTSSNQAAEKLKGHFRELAVAIRGSAASIGSLVNLPIDFSQTEILELKVNLLHAIVVLQDAERRLEGIQDYEFNELVGVEWSVTEWERFLKS